MTKSIRIIATCFLFAATSTANVSAADDCVSLDREAEIAKVLGQHAESKVLKVEESKDARGCTQFIIRILVDGTVQAITVPNRTGA